MAMYKANQRMMNTDGGGRISGAGRDIALILLTAGILTLILAGCFIDPVPRDFNYRFTVEVENVSELPLTIEIEAPPGAEGFTSDPTVLDIAWSHSFEGEINYSAEQELVVIGIAGDLGPNESFTVRIYYEELSASPWIKDAALIDEATVHYPDGDDPAPVEFRRVFTVPR